MPNYANSKIYKIWSPTHLDEIYIGSTSVPLSHRMAKHRYKYKMYKEGKTHYVTSFKILEYGDARIELIENVECKCKEELIAREGYYVRTLDCVNKVIPDRTQKEWRQENKEKIAQYKKEWYEKNRELTLQRAKEYAEKNKEKIAQYKKEWNKKYYQDNKERLAQKDKEYYKKNKEKLNEKTTCECGSTVSRRGIARHKKTKKHIQYLESK